MSVCIEQIHCLLYSSNYKIMVCFHLLVFFGGFYFFLSWLCFYGCYSQFKKGTSLYPWRIQSIMTFHICIEFDEKWKNFHICIDFLEKWKKIYMNKIKNNKDFIKNEIMLFVFFFKRKGEMKLLNFNVLRLIGLEPAI